MTTKTIKTKIYSVQIQVIDGVTPEQVHEAICVALHETNDYASNVGDLMYVKDEIIDQPEAT